MSILESQFARAMENRRVRLSGVVVTHEASDACTHQDLCYYKKKYGVRAFNTPKRTPNHKTKSHLVVAKFKNKQGKMVIKVIRFGQQGVSGEGKAAKKDSKKEKARRRSFKARHESNIAKGRGSAAFWANKTKW